MRLFNRYIQGGELEASVLNYILGSWMSGLFGPTPTTASRNRLYYPLPSMQRPQYVEGQPKLAESA